MAADRYAAIEASVRASLHAAVREAWGVGRIYADPSAEPVGALPVAFVLLPQVTQDEEEASVTFDAVRLEYEIVLRQKKPVSRTQDAAGTQALDALRLLLMEGARFVDDQGRHWNREWISDSLIDPGRLEREATSTFFDVSVRLAIIVRVPAL